MTMHNRHLDKGKLCFMDREKQAGNETINSKQKKQEIPKNHDDCCSAEQVETAFSTCYWEPLFAYEGVTLSMVNQK